ncbi:hypothetical protein [Chenggangzhangella methanolivorans]|uniref:Uncharacterized protein n=1 Tax=Chenggangzhangella methanolivorans TaxID=1437009 RepID=A0A9E6UM08_9HYPH|nr:hypothetical protein [Chenggangzhangella methanolivorans]QZN99565.1 hypothetical protein K6K41_23115 [Chenggangzhangella methanolivorans]
MIVAKLVVAAGLIHAQATTTNIDIPHDSAVRALAIADQCDPDKIYTDVIRVVALSVGLNFDKPSEADADIIAATRAQYKRFRKTDGSWPVSSSPA